MSTLGGALDYENLGSSEWIRVGPCRLDVEDREQLPLLEVV